MIHFGSRAAIVSLLFAAAAGAQVTPAATTTRPDDTPKIAIGATMFADYTFLQSPEAKDADGNAIHANSFNITRAYINFTGSLNHWIGFRVTPDIARETGSGSSLSGSLNFRLKYAFGQFNLDDWAKGAWLRFGLQQTPWLDYEESVYRYRFQGPMFTDREGYLTASDFGFAGHYELPGNYGEIHAGVYNGEGYSHPEANNEKSFQIRGTLTPLPRAGVWKGLRLTAFIDQDHYQQSAIKARYVGQIAFQHPRVTAAVEYLHANDRTSVTKPEAVAKGYSAWVTPKLGHGWELLLRHDDLEPNEATKARRKRNIAGIAYWFPHMQRVTSAVLADYDSYGQSGIAPAPPKTTAYGIKMLINF